MARTLQIAATFIFGSCIAVSAEELNLEAFVDELNRELAEVGASVETYSELNSSLPDDGVGLSIQVPDYGVTATDRDGNILGVFGSDVPVTRDEEGTITSVRGFMPDASVTYNVIPADKYASLLVAASSEPTKSVRRAVSKFAAASDHIAARLCSYASRPSNIEFHLDANFELVLGAGTGAKATWRLDETCQRVAEANQ